MFGGSLGGCQRVKGRAGANFKVLSPTFVVRYARRNNIQERFRQGQHIRLQGRENGGKSATLFRRSEDLQGSLSIATQREGVVHASDGFAGRFHLVAMQQVDWNQNILNGAEQRAFANIIFAQSAEGGRRPLP